MSLPDTLLSGAAPASPSLFGRIAIVGSGSIGLYYGGRLALAGNDVRFLVRSDREAIDHRGIFLREGGREDVVYPAQGYATPEELGPVDLVLITLKTTANDQLPTLLPPLVHAGTTVATLQNGLGNEDFLATLVPPENVVGGLSFIASTRTAPGEVTCYQRGSITFGERGRPANDRTRALGAMFERAGIPNRVVDQLDDARWRKLVWNIPFNGLSIAAGGVATNVICSEPHLVAEVRALMTEVRTAAAALGHVIPEAFAQKQLEVTPSMGAYQPSSMVDFLARRPVEVEPIFGEPLRRARAAGAVVPKMELLYALLRQLTRTEKEKT
ncbi:MAG TPA: 2-dehydropantoate 2-reductase [Opitutaceae bacterium]|nr:2-dehydropantoate 2-reductase [Opitutaceae bacterium]